MGICTNRYTKFLTDTRTIIISKSTAPACRKISKKIRARKKWILSEIVAESTFNRCKSDLEHPADPFKCYFNYFRPEIHCFWLFYFFSRISKSRRICEPKQKPPHIHVRRLSGYMYERKRGISLRKCGTSMVLC